MILSTVSRLLINLLTLVFVLLVTFFILHTIPGGPFDQERVLPPEIQENLYHKYGLQKQGDQNFWVWVAQDFKSYSSYLKHGQLGPSLKYRDRDVAEIIEKALPPSLELGFYSLLLSCTVGILLGIVSSLNPQGFLNKILQSLSALFVSFPTFVLAAFFILIFCYWSHLLPPALWEGWKSRILPILTLSLAPIAYFLKLTETGMEEQLKKDFIRTAKSKGLSQNKIIFKHALKNAATPLLTILGPLTAYLITGSFIVETVYAIPGLGKHFITAVIDRDYFLVMGITLLYAVLLIGLNTLVDVGYLFLDPRLRKKT